MPKTGAERLTGMNASLQPTSQSQFAVLFALPVSEQEFFTAASADPLSDYMRLTLGGRDAEATWAQRYARIVDAAGTLLQRLDSLQVATFRRATLEDLAIASSGAQILVVFAHWSGALSLDSLTGREAGWLELEDGLHDAAAVERALAPTFTGTVDLCTCKSVSLAAHLKARRGDRLRTLYTQHPLDPLPAFVIVRELIDLCLRSGADYGLTRLQVAADLALRQSWH